jgi:hypothetical protein
MTVPLGIEEYINKWGEISWSSIKILNIIKVPSLPKLICALNGIPIKILVDFFQTN